MAKKIKTITFNGDGVRTCKCCETPISKTTIYSGACSAECVKELIEYRKIDVPNLFVKNLYFRTNNQNEIAEQLKSYAKRFNYSFHIVIAKYEEKVKVIKQKGFGALTKKAIYAA